MTKHAQKGFTLAELLIALAILGVIATFTIPKILTSTGTAQFRATTKEAASIISGAIQDFGVSNAVTGSTTFASTLANVNYVQQLTSGAATAATGLNNDCAASHPCLVLHNGGILQYGSNATFGSTANTSYVTVNFDPDGTKGTTATDIVTFVVSAQGKVVDVTNATASGFTTEGGGANKVTAEAASPAWATTPSLWQ